MSDDWLDRVEHRTGLRLTDRDRALTPIPDDAGPCDPVELGVWISLAADDDALVCAARVALELRAERRATRQAGLDIHAAGGTEFWRSATERSRPPGRNYIPRTAARCDDCHGRLHIPAPRRGGAAA